MLAKANVSVYVCTYLQAHGLTHHTPCHTYPWLACSFISYHSVCKIISEFFEYVCMMFAGRREICASKAACCSVWWSSNHTAASVLCLEGRPSGNLEGPQPGSEQGAAGDGCGESGVRQVLPVGCLAGRVALARWTLEGMPLDSFFEKPVSTEASVSIQFDCAVFTTWEEHCFHQK